jgi:hypothetical protein
MGEITDDILDGFQCSGCGVCFEKEHGYPVLCGYCWERGVMRSEGISLATEREL